MEFDLLDSNKSIIQSGLKTNSKGEITIEQILPGKYYLIEKKTLDGYVKNDEEIEIDVKLNQEFTVTVDNYKEVKVKVEKKEAKQSVKKLPVTGM